MKKESIIKSDVELGSEKEPELSFDLLFSRHRTEKDAMQIAKHLERSDIYAPEFILQKREAKRIEYLLNQLAKGELTVQEYELIESRGTDFIHALHEAVYKSNKHIILADTIDDGAPRRSLKYLESQTLYRDLSNHFSDGNLTLVMDDIENMARMIVANELGNREKAYIENLKGKIKDLIKESPELSKKDKIVTLITFGTAHLGLYHKFKQDPEFENADLTRTFNSGASLNFGHYLQLIQRIRYRKLVDKELLAKTAMELLLVLEFIKQTGLQREEDDDNKITKMVNKLTLADIHEVFYKISKKDKQISSILNDYDINIRLVRDEQS